MSVKAFERILDKERVTPRDQKILMLFTLELSERSNNLRLKEIVDAKKAFEAHQKSQQLSNPRGLSRADRRTAERTNKKKGKR